MRTLAAAGALAILAQTGSYALAQDSQDSEAQTDPEIARAIQEEDLKQKQIATEKAQTDAEKAAYDLEAARRKEIVDTLPASSTSGKVDIKTDAGKIEANAMTALAINALAPKIADAARDAAVASRSDPVLANDEITCGTLPLAQAPQPATGLPPVLLMPGKEKLTFNSWNHFRFQACVIHEQFNRAAAAAKTELGIKAVTPPPPGDDTVGAIDPATIATAISAGSKLLQLLTPDWELGGIGTAVTDKGLASAVAGAYATKTASSGEKGRIYWGGQVSKLGGSKVVFDALHALDRQDREAAGFVDGLKGKSKTHADEVARIAKKKKPTEADKARKAAAEREVARLKKLIDPLTEAQAAHAALVKSLQGKEGEAVPPINQVIDEAVAARLLGATGVVLNLELEAQGGSYYTRKSLWDVLGIGGVPFWGSGGAVVSFTATRPADQQVLRGGELACLAGFKRLSRVAAHVNAGSNGCPTGRRTR